MTVDKIREALAELEYTRAISRRTVRTRLEPAYSALPEFSRDTYRALADETLDVLRKHGWVSEQ